MASCLKAISLKQVNKQNYIFGGVALYKAKMYMTSTKLNNKKAAMYVSPSIPEGVKYFIV